MQPMVYGYLRTSEAEGGQLDIQRLTETLTAYSEREGLLLGAVFFDDQAHPRSTHEWLPGFAALLDALQAGEADGVLLPARHHLSRQPELQASRARQIEDSGVRVYVVAAEPQAYASNGGGPRRVQ